jgi:peptide deformylase
MVFPIVAYGDPVLRKIAQPIEKDDSLNLVELIENMYETMYASAGVGLAAPQVGMAIRLFVVDGTPFNEGEDEPDPTLFGFKKVFINPTIVSETGDEWAFEEGCLSIPGIRADVYRQERVKITYFDADWNELTETFEGTAARIVQHEYDHLEGKLFTDHLPLIKRQLLKKKLSDITKGNVSVDYRMRFPRF